MQVIESLNYRIEYDDTCYVIITGVGKTQAAITVQAVFDAPIGLFRISPLSNKTLITDVSFYAIVNSPIQEHITLDLDNDSTSNTLLPYFVLGGTGDYTYDWQAKQLVFSAFELDIYPGSNAIYKSLLFNFSHNLV